MAETDIAMPESTPVDSRPAFAIVEELKTKFGENFYVQATFEEFPTVWVERARVQEVLMFLRKVERQQQHQRGKTHTPSEVAVKTTREGV